MKDELKILFKKDPDLASEVARILGFKIEARKKKKLKAKPTAENPKKMYNSRKKDAVKLQDFIKEFVKDDEFYKYYKTANDFYGKCDGIANSFYTFLINKDLKNASIITGIGYLKDLPDNAADKAKENEPEFLTHVVVRVGNKVVDLTGKQFGEKNIRIIPFSTFKKEWKKIKKGPYWKINKYL